MIKFLIALLCINFLNAFGALDNDETTAVVVSPSRPLNPENGFIRKGSFCLITLRTEFADQLSGTFSNPEVMQYVGDGKIIKPFALRGNFLLRSHEMKQGLGSYYWAVGTHDGICGVVNAISKGIEGELEVSFILSPSVQGNGISKRLLEAVFEYFPNKRWSATVHPNNERSRRSLKSAGFAAHETRYVEKYGADRIFCKRPPNEELENKEKIYFTYRDAHIPLYELLAS
jgi:RimJ/RimL family protein N-acetyltransferase